MSLATVDRRTLQFGPLWILSALAGTYNRFGPEELASFWDTIVAVALRSSSPARDILASMTDDRPQLLADFASDNRPIVSGLRHVVQVLDCLEPEVSESYRLALLRIGVALGRARGPFGRTILPEQEQLLLLIAELLEVDGEAPISEKAFA